MSAVDTEDLVVPEARALIAETLERTALSEDAAARLAAALSAALDHLEVSPAVQHETAAIITRILAWGDLAP